MKNASAQLNMTDSSKVWMAAARGMSKLHAGARARAMRVTHTP
jgi:hypothetical protein